jgi:hypothetical protein
MQRKEEKSCASSASSSSQGSTADPRFDTPFNRATNRLKGRAKSLPPTSSGRVSGYGTYEKVGNFRKEDPEAKKERKAAAAAAEAASGKRELEELREQMPRMIAEQVQEKMRELLPEELWQGLAAWNAGGRRGPLVVPSFSGSNSIQHVSPDVVTPEAANIATPQPAVTPVPPPVANTNAQPVVADLVTPPTAQPVPPPATTKAQPTVLRKASRLENDTGDVSTLAELAAISKVMTLANTFHFLCL